MSLSSLAMMYIFRWGMIHSAVASIYNCLWPTWVEQTDVSLQAGHESDSLLNQDTVFLISFTNHFTSNDSYLQSLRPLPRCLPLHPPLNPLTPPPSLLSPRPSFSPPAPFLPPISSTKTALKGKNGSITPKSQTTACIVGIPAQLPEYDHTWLTANAPTNLFPIFPFPRCMKIICTVLLSSHFTYTFYHWHASLPASGCFVFFNYIYWLYLYTNVILTMTHITEIGWRFDHDAFDMFNQSDHLQIAKLFHKTIWSIQLKMHILAAANWHHQSFGAAGCRGHNRHIHTCPRVHAHSCNKAGKDTVSLELSSVNHLLVCMDSCSVNWSAPCMDMFKRGCRDIDVSYEANGGKKWFLSFSNG